MGINWRTGDWRAWLRARQFTAPELQRSIEIAMIALVGCALLGLGWALLAPTTPADGQPGAPVRFDATPASFAAFDPFNRLSTASAGSAVVTSLDLTLHGVRADRASGRGSAIIGLPDGSQNSYAVGEEIVPGAVLAAVGFDSVTIRRDGAKETLYLDQSEAAPAASASLASPQPDPFAAIRATDSGRPPLIADVSAEPRLRGGKVDGYVLKPAAGGAAFAAAGLQPGDVLLTIAGRRVGEGVGIEQLAGGKPVAVEVERGGALVQLTIGEAR